MIAVGGGITGDLAGFIASIFKRGLQFVNIPTTLLAQVDYAIGGKTGINSIYGKNLIGTFYQPKLVISDTIFLKSLPRREIICGYGEILKHSIISNKKFFQFLNNNFEKILKFKSPYIEKAIYFFTSKLVYLFLTAPKYFFDGGGHFRNISRIGWGLF